MPTEKHLQVYGFASPRIFLVAAGAGLLLIGVGIYAHSKAPKNDSVLPASTVAPSPTETATESPSPTPSVSPSPTVLVPVSVDAARAAYAAKDYPKAISLFAQAVQQAQGATAIAQLQYELGNSYRENNQNDQALSTYALAIAQNPKLVVAYQARANLLISLGRRAEAKTVLQAGLNANPGNQNLENDLSTVDLSGPSGDY